MRKIALALFLAGAFSFADEVSAYKAGWVDGFRTGYSLKNVKKVNIPAGFWLYMPSENLSMEYIGFYVFSAQRLGLKSYLTGKEIVFGVFSRRADAEFYRNLLIAKGIEGLEVDKREGAVGYEGEVFVVDKSGEAKTGVDGVYYHLQKAIEKAKEIDPTVLNRDLLVQDLKSILSQISKWRSGEKGYKRVMEEQESSQLPDIVEKFLKEK